MATNRELLEDAGIIKSDAQLTPEQEEAISSLTNQEVQALVSVKNKVSGAFPATEETGAAGVGIIEHHH